jgi:Leucine zipper with capping helix domain
VFATVQAEADRVSTSLTAKLEEQSDGEAKAELAAQLTELEAQKAELLKQRQALEVVDPERFAAMKEAAGIAKQAANRWLDNTEALHDWVRKKFPGKEDEVDKHFENAGLTEKLKYIE